MELMDLYDKNRVFSGMTAPRGVPVPPGLFHLGVHAYIRTPSAQYLLQQRSAYKALLPGAWDILMGHVRAGETSKDALLREIDEEIGLPVLPGIRLAGSILCREEGHWIDVYIVEARFYLHDLTLRENEVADVGFISREEMADRVRTMARPQNYRTLVLDALKEL